MTENTSTDLIKSPTVSPALARVSGQLAVTERLLNISSSFSQGKIETKNACPTIEEWKKLSNTEKRRVWDASEEFRVKLRDYNDNLDVSNYVKGEVLKNRLVDKTITTSGNYGEQLTKQLDRLARNLVLTKQKLEKNPRTKLLLQRALSKFNEDSE